jgi:hypothetical protein
MTTSSTPTRHNVKTMQRLVLAGGVLAMAATPLVAAAQGTYGQTYGNQPYGQTVQPTYGQSQTPDYNDPNAQYNNQQYQPAIAATAEPAVPAIPTAAIIATPPRPRTRHAQRL